MKPDPLSEVLWECWSSEPGRATNPDELYSDAPSWMPAVVPGTAAGAAFANGVGHGGAWDRDLVEELDGRDWWFRCRFALEQEDSSTARGAQASSTGTGGWMLGVEGLATIADVWINGRHVLRSESMFEHHEVPAGELIAENEMLIRFSALAPLLRAKRPRPRWKTLLATNQNLRWFRTTLLGRQTGWAVTPPPVGPWRPLRLYREDELRVCAGWIRTTCEPDGSSGHVEVSLQLSGVSGASGVSAESGASEASGVPEGATIHVGAGTSGHLDVRPAGRSLSRRGPERFAVEGRLDIEGVERWWPHTHGSQPLYEVAIEVGGKRVDLGRVGFRTIEVDRSGGAFDVSVNGVSVFCRGACWFPIDPSNMAASREDLCTTLELVRDAGMNMLRVPGGTVYEEESFWDVCDELGIMVWQDAMLGYLDPPQDEAFQDAITKEVLQVLSGLVRHPSLAVFCGGQEIEEQAAFFGLPREQWVPPLLEDVLPKLVSQVAPGLPYVTSSPTGGSQPSRPDNGVSHYFGTGSYLRELSDLKTCGLRFASECLALAVPPERETVDECFGGARGAGHDPSWKQALHHDTGRSWDTEDYRDHYVQKLFGVDSHLLRYSDPEYALDMGRAAACEITREAFTQWRRRSSCGGALLVALRDLVPGAGWGVIDALGRPKAPWFVLRRVLAPVSVLVSDEGLNGLSLDVVNDADSPFSGFLRVELFAGSELLVESAEREISLGPRSACEFDASDMFERFVDLTYAYRFGPPAHDVVLVSLHDSRKGVVSEAVHLPAGTYEAREPDVGLAASARPDPASPGEWTLEVATRRLARYVCVDVPGFAPQDSWFHLAPGRSRTLSLRPSGGAEAPRGRVRALNLQQPVTVEVRA